MSVRGDPFPHIAIDDFLPTALLDRCLENFPIADATRHIFYSLNSRPFLQLLENITAIKGLIPDPYYLGDG